MEKIVIIPVYVEIDERDPERVYEAVKGVDTYLLESCEGGEKVARYSFIGFDPAAKLSFKGKKPLYQPIDPILEGIGITGNNPLEALREIMSQFELKTPALSRFFGGFVGFFSYDLIRYYSDPKGNAVDDLKEPVCELILTKNNVIFDHKKKKAYLLSHQFISKGSKFHKKEALKDLKRIKKGILNKIKNQDLKTICQHNLSTSGNRGYNAYKSNITQEKFEENVRKAKEYIYAGDIFQVVLSQRLEASFKGDELDVYKALKKINPSPYMYCINFGDRKIVGSSPEMLARVENRRVETYPIAGTRPRGIDEREDRIFEEEMLADEKECAEHVMLVDLGRNDIGRVAKFGTVKVNKFMTVEKYSHVQHMVSEVSGTLRDDLDEFDAFLSIFPAGTVSGAPKVRAMEIIDELETSRRGVYAGAIGYFSFNRNMDTAISIRTIILEKDKAYIQAGAGIVADSKPEAEFQETLNKAKAMLNALKEAETE